MIVNTKLGLDKTIIFVTLMQVPKLDWYKKRSIIITLTMGAGLKMPFLSTFCSGSTDIGWGLIHVEIEVWYQYDVWLNGS